jgi:hypothetical protein
MTIWASVHIMLHQCYINVHFMCLCVCMYVYVLHLTHVHWGVLCNAVACAMLHEMGRTTGDLAFRLAWG